MTPTGSPFLGVTAVVLAFNFIVGLMTLGRILGTTADDLRAVHAMARIRHGYLQVRPELRPYITTDGISGWFDTFSHSGGYDANGAFARFGIASRVVANVNAAGTTTISAPRTARIRYSSGKRRS